MQEGLLQLFLPGLFLQKFHFALNKDEGFTVNSMFGTVKNKRQPRLLWNQNTDSRFQPDAALKWLTSREGNSVFFPLLLCILRWIQEGGTWTNTLVKNYWDFLHLTPAAPAPFLPLLIHSPPLPPITLWKSCSFYLLSRFLSASHPAFLYRGQTYTSLCVTRQNWCKPALPGRARGWLHLLKLRPFVCKRGLPAKHGQELSCMLQKVLTF